MSTRRSPQVDSPRSAFYNEETNEITPMEQLDGCTASADTNFERAKPYVIGGFEETIDGFVYDYGKDAEYNSVDDSTYVPSEHSDDDLLIGNNFNDEEEDSDDELHIDNDFRVWTIVIMNCSKRDDSNLSNDICIILN